MRELAQQIDVAVAGIRQRWSGRPQVGIILGTGLGKLADHIQADAKIPYGDIQHFPRSTALGHLGQLVCGRLRTVQVLAMQGRFHPYEGYRAGQATFPIRVMRAMGIELLIVSNASGGLNPRYRSGDVMLIDDHVNLMWRNPLHGNNDDDLGPRFPDMSCPYDLELIEASLAVARRQGLACHRGVYAAMSGPNYETRAEYRFLRQIGADVVGMSTVPEVIVAVHAGLRVLGLSVVTNLCCPDVLQSTTGQAVRDAATLAEPTVRCIVESLVSNLNKGKCSE